jgi:hypothetical protein
MFKITVPNPDFSGDRLGLQFTRGQATTNDIELANLFKSFDGYTVTEEKPKTKAKANPVVSHDTKVIVTNH